MRREILKRLQNLEATAAQRIVCWIGPPEGGLHGWEILGNDGPIHVWRQEGETDDALQARAAAAANGNQGMVVAFAMDAQGVTR